jgi:hypothetical protein
MQHFVIKFASDLLQADDFLTVQVRDVVEL